MARRIPLYIDTDPGVDDALAILMAFDSPAHDVVGLGIAAGNVGLDHTVRNALKLCEVANRNDVPVYAGCPAPLLHALWALSRALTTGFCRTMPSGVTDCTSGSGGASSMESAAKAGGAAKAMMASPTDNPEAFRELVM